MKPLVAARNSGFRLPEFRLPTGSLKIRSEITLIESNRQRVKTVSQIAAEGMELQKVEAERAKRRMESTLKQNADTATPNLGERGESTEHVASALGISPEQWRKLRTVFQKAQSGDAEAKELMKALDAGDIFAARIPSLHAP